MTGDGEKASAPPEYTNRPADGHSPVPDDGDADFEKTGSAPAAPPKPDVQAGAVLKHADKNDADEAYKVLVGHESETIVITPEEEKKLLRKIDLNLMPLLCIVYGLNYLDKTTVSYASVMGLKVNLTPPNIFIYRPTELYSVSNADLLLIDGYQTGW